MRYALFVIIVLLTNKTVAQQHVRTDSLLGFKMLNPEELHIPTDDLKKYIGKGGYIYDNIWGVKVINDTLKVLYVGGRYPYHKVSILIQGHKTIQQLSHLYDGVASHFSGKVVMYEGKPAIIITRDTQILEQIML